jgi:hypothetical protein
LALGRSVRECQDTIDSREFSEWMAFYQLEPFGPERLDVGSAIVAATIANVHRGRAARAFKPGDFLPEFGPPKRQTQEQMAQVFGQFAEAHNAWQRRLPT